MDTNQIEAKKALQEAEAMFNAGDVLATHLEAYRIHSAFNHKSQDKAHWYSILNVKRSFGLETIRKQFKELRALAHPDKSSSAAAEGAFELVYRAWKAICQDLNSSSTSNKTRNSAKCPECSCQCVYLESRSRVLECKRCKLIAMRGGKEEEGVMVVIRDGIANINVGGELNTVNVRGGGNTTVNGVTGVNVYRGESVQLNQCMGVSLKGGKDIHMRNCTRISIKGSGI